MQVRPWSEIRDDVQETMRPLVKWMRDLGYETTDSGDGVANVEMGMEDALEVPHVFAFLDGADAISEADRLFEALGVIGVEAQVEVSYSPNDRKHVLAVWPADLSDATARVLGCHQEPELDLPVCEVTGGEDGDGDGGDGGMLFDDLLDDGPEASGCGGGCGGCNCGGL